ncbi:MAG: hypothetical protein ACRDUY_02665 [Nitriliruptorales bacterium]
MTDDFEKRLRGTLRQYAASTEVSDPPPLKEQALRARRRSLRRKFVQRPNVRRSPRLAVALPLAVVLFGAAIASGFTVWMSRGTVPVEILSAAVAAARDLESFAYESELAIDLGEQGAYSVMAVGTTDVSTGDGQVEVTVTIDQRAMSNLILEDCTISVAPQDFFTGQDILAPCVTDGTIQQLEYEMRRVAGVVYQRPKAQGAEEQPDWTSSSAPRSLYPLRPTLLDGSSLLEALANVGDVEELGSEEFRGRTTSLYGAQLSMAASEAFWRNARTGESADPRESPADGTVDPPVDDVDPPVDDLEPAVTWVIWIDDEGLLRRVQMAQGPAIRSTGSRTATASLDLVILDYGVPVKVRRPPTE